MRLDSDSGPLLYACATAGLGAVRAVLPRRLDASRWVRYRIDLTDALPPAPGVSLTAVTDEIIERLRRHPDCGENQLKSGLRFWELGLQRAYVWMGDDGPRCIQWLLTHADAPRLPGLGDWAGMYAPLSPDVGQVENLFAFSTARHKGVASRFEYALYREARGIGLRRLVTHIHEGNAAARAWADRTGWRRCGTITRYEMNLPGLRARSVYVHRDDAGRAERTPWPGRPAPISAGRGTPPPSAPGCAAT